MSLPTIGAVLVCDDIRKEVNNKDILIGVYAADILVPAFPAWLSVAVWMEMTPHEIGETDLRFRVAIGKNGVEIGMRLDARTLNPVGVALPGLQLQAEEETEITVEINENENWRLLKTKKVLRGTFKLPLAMAATASGTT